MAPAPELNGSGLYTRVSTAESTSIAEGTTGDCIELSTEFIENENVNTSHASDVRKSSIKLSSSMASLSRTSNQTLSQALGSPRSLKTLKDLIKRRWGWIVTLCSFCIYFLYNGFISCFTLLFVHLQEEFRSSATETGWVGSMAVGLSHFYTPLTNYLIIRLGSTRLVVFLGVVSSSLGLILSSFVPDVYYLYGTIGILYGIGFNFTLHSSMVLLVQYYPGRNCTRCVSLTYLGSPAGMFVISLAMNASLNAVGWRATLRLFGAAFFVIGSCCCLPLIASPNVGQEEMIEKVNMVKEEEQEEDAEKTKCLEVVSCENVNMKVVSEHGDETIRKEDEVLTSSSLNSLKSFMTLAPAWISSIGFLVNALAQTFHSINFVGHLHVIGLADHGAIMITSLAAGEICGKLLLAVFGVKLPYSKGYLLAASNLACALATIPVAVVTSAPALIALSAGLGVLRSGHMVLGPPFLVEYFGILRIYEATAALMIAVGIGYLLGAVVMGLSYDYTGSYVISIIVATVLFIISGVLFLALQLRRKWIQARQKKQLQKECEACAEPLSQQTAPMYFDA